MYGASSLTAVVRNRGHPHRHLVAVGIAQFNRFDRQLSRRSRINNKSTDLSRHGRSPVKPGYIQMHAVDRVRDGMPW
jgi:hypothetical protein